MKMQINCTEKGIKQYPIHKHKNYEIMLYIKGNGYLKTEYTDYPFSPGTIIIVPPNTEHGSVSKNGFFNISIEGEFGHLLYFDNPVTCFDNAEQEGLKLAELIYKNRFLNKEYLWSLGVAYIYFLNQQFEKNAPISDAVKDIVSKIMENYADSHINIREFLSESGYAEDYIRSYFKKMTESTPNEFLTKTRIERACFLIDIYGKALSLSEVSEKCGYLDYAYFSKKFKKYTGISPKQYAKQEK